ncbi:zinc finger protein 28 [Bombyx mori]|uniref:C2H2-type domain-containing protein n=1 Tax=Bombyx mori TaxID=7091 RepID=A0A8R1WLG3_BOMMO|nr:zinc finger protein 28 [Bombyx mori]XP_037876419.1 zinc finger protein 28 [Bombyx mori]XP_037876420.1 zinc finger protein 28 [Bombyx mori]XP_037876421.1 zinc finger protein 28 [Bombyx mori]
MMFDPPDYPYKELAEVYETQSLLFSGNNETKTLEAPSIDTTDNQLTLESNVSGQYFNVESILVRESENLMEQATECYVVQDDNLFNFESTLLDENTVNQFLLPAKGSTEANRDEQNGPDVLALHSCVICHEIFTTESDLLDHTILLHASSQTDSGILEHPTEATKKGTNDFDFEAEWLVCRICERVLSTILEKEPNEQLCCLDYDGVSKVASRKLTTMYVCDVCNGLFADCDALDKHRQNCYIEELTKQQNFSVSPEATFSCDICDKQYYTNEDLKIHSLDCRKNFPPRTRKQNYTSAGNTKMWNCGSCNQLFTTARELYRHKRGEDRPEGAPLLAYVCDECDKVLGSMCALHTHKKMHKVSKPGYPCRVCGRRFNQSGHLAIHMRMHTGERPYPCDLCPKAFKVKVERDDHRRTHTGERPFACAACHKTFTAAARLREHARIHTDQRPYRCDICGAAFRRPYARTVHTLIHTGEKPHECDVCGTAFRRSGDMWKHKRTLHGIRTNCTDTKRDVE